MYFLFSDASASPFIINQVDKVLNVVVLRATKLDLVDKVELCTCCPRSGEFS